MREGGDAHSAAGRRAGRDGIAGGYNGRKGEKEEGQTSWRWGQTRDQGMRGRAVWEAEGRVATVARGESSIFARVKADGATCAAAVVKDARLASSQAAPARRLRTKPSPHTSLFTQPAIHQPTNVPPKSLHKPPQSTPDPTNAQLPRPPLHPRPLPLPRPLSPVREPAPHLHPVEPALVHQARGPLTAGVEVPGGPGALQGEEGGGGEGRASAGGAPGGGGGGGDGGGWECRRRGGCDWGGRSEGGRVRRGWGAREGGATERDGGGRAVLRRGVVDMWRPAVGSGAPRARRLRR